MHPYLAPIFVVLAFVVVARLLVLAIDAVFKN